MMGMPRSTARSAWVLAASLVCAWASPISAARVDPVAEAGRLVAELERSVQGAAPAPTSRRTDARALLARGKAELAAGRYATALDILHQALELEATSPSPAGLEPEIEFLLGGVYFDAGQPYSAHRHFLAVANRSGEPEFAPFAGRAVARLVDAAFATQNPDLLPPLTELLDRLLGVERSDELYYARAKLAFALGHYREARDVIAMISGGGLTYKRGLYLKGAALAKEAGGRREGLALAIAEFERAVQAPAPEDQVRSRQISDVARLAVARLHYENGAFDQAVASFTRVDRGSPVFSEALFELAWAYVKQADFTRAEQTLAALSVLDPGLIDGADAALLRADMLLRSGHFHDAEKLYLATYQTYEPLRRDLDDCLARHASGADYYQRLLRSELEAGQELPKALMDLVREEAREHRLFAVVDEVARSRRLLGDARRVGTLARATLSGPTRARLFPELEARLEPLLAHENQLARAQLVLARGLDRVAGSPSSELAAVRHERRGLMDQVAALGTTSAELLAREAKAQLSWTALGQALKRLEVEADQTQALCNGLRRVLADADAQRIAIGEEAKRRYREDLTRGEQDLVRFRQTIEELRQQLAIGKVRAGFGDEKTARDRKLGHRFSSLVEQEFRLVASGSDRSQKARRYAAEAANVLAKMIGVGAKLSAERADLDQRLLASGDEMAHRVLAELERLAATEAALNELERDHGELLGLAAKKSFVSVRDRLSRVVRHAELGMAQKSFEVREERRRRVERLKRQRARETKLIQDELSEVMGESEGEP
jgi:hypothetical protein